MKGLQLKIIIAVCALFIGVGAVVLFSNNFQRTESDQTVYIISLSELADNPRQYDGKLVLVSAYLMGVGIDTQPYLAGGSKEIYIDCKGEFCVQMYNETRRIQKSDNYSLRTRITVIGRFWAQTKLPETLMGLETKQVMLLEITELKAIEAVK